MKKEYFLEKIFIGRLNYGSDILSELTSICEDLNIFAGKIEAFGAVQRATIGYYDQKSKEYRWNKLNKPMEILSFIGNISLKDNKPFVHAHITLADEEGRVYGGHLTNDTVVFAFEYTIFCFKGESLNRIYDESTGLFLWKF